MFFYYRMFLAVKNMQYKIRCSSHWQIALSFFFKVLKLKNMFFLMFFIHNLCFNIYDQQDVTPVAESTAPEHWEMKD